MSHLIALTLSMNILPFNTDSILTVVSIVLELDSTKYIEAITIDVHRNMIPRNRIFDHFFSSLYFT